MYLGTLIMFGRGGVYADEEHKDKKERKVMCVCVRETGGVRLVG